VKELRVKVGDKVSEGSVILLLDAGGATEEAKPAAAKAPAPAAPAAPDLRASSDTGASDTDNITSVAAPVFDVTGNPYYRVYRDGTLVATKAASARSHSVSGLTCGTSYTISLTAIDAAGNESYAPEATGTTSTSACAAKKSSSFGTVGLLGGL